MKVNADECHLLVSYDKSCTAKIENFIIKNSAEEKLLGVKFDSNLFLKTISPFFLRRHAISYTLLEKYHINRLK